MKITLLTIAVVMFAATQASAALLLTNGGFELPDASGGGVVTNAGDTANSWTAVNNLSFTTEPFDGTTAAQEGGQYIQQTTGTGGASLLGRVSQFLGMTDAISDITLGASFTQRDQGVAGGYSFGLYSDAAGTVALAETLNQSAGALGSDIWTTDSVTAVGVASGVSVYAFLTAAVPASSTNFLNIDAVTLSVTEIPEPSSMLLVGLGVLGLGVVRRRRQR